MPFFCRTSVLCSRKGLGLTQPAWRGPTPHRALMDEGCRCRRSLAGCLPLFPLQGKGCTASKPCMHSQRSAGTHRNYLGLHGALVLVQTQLIVVWPRRVVLGWARREHEWHRHRSAFLSHWALYCITELSSVVQSTANLMACCLDAQYDLSVSTFSPDGRVFQTDYAQKAADNSGCDGWSLYVPMPSYQDTP